MVPARPYWLLRRRGPSRCSADLPPVATAIPHHRFVWVNPIRAVLPSLGNTRGGGGYGSDWAIAVPNDARRPTPPQAAAPPTRPAPRGTRAPAAERSTRGRAAAGGPPDASLCGVGAGLNSVAEVRRHACVRPAAWLGSWAWLRRSVSSTSGSASGTCSIRLADTSAAAGSS